MKLAPLAFFFSLALPLFAQSTALPSDASSMKPGEISEHWNRQGEEVSPTRRFSTRSVGSSSPQVGMSKEAAEANAETLRLLSTRGIRWLTGAAAAQAQRAQDARETNPQSRAQPTPEVFVELPFDESRKIAFRIRFKRDSTDLADSESTALIDKAAEAMQQNPKLIFLLEGHTCDIGAVDYNQALSEKRALRLRQLLVDHKKHPVPGNRLLAIGRGLSKPLTPNRDDPSRAENRRVMIGPVELPEAESAAKPSPAKP
ncbi:MAG: OmpA family protein [Verrucomicrobiaceae bacterium]